jgi:hypothetical protein
VNGLKQMRNDICRSFKLQCRKHQAAPAKKRPPAVAAKPAVKPVAKPEGNAAPESTKPVMEAAKPQEVLPKVPTPELKPQPPTPPVVKEAAKPAAAPIPRAKPVEAAAKAADAPAPVIPQAQPPVTGELVIPIPRNRPSLLPTLPPVAPAIVRIPEAPSETTPPDATPSVVKRAESKPPEAKPPETATASIAPNTAPAEGASDCQRGLRNSKVTFDVEAVSFGQATCPVVDHVRLHSVVTPSGTVTFPDGPVFNCRFAQQFARWVSDTGSAVVLAQMNKRLEKVATGPGYDCRHRNGDSSGKMSEHAAGDAVDITSMTMAGGTTIRVADAINPAAPSYAVLRVLRTTACGYFSTVLGPGSNEAHKEHYHFDLGIHGKSGNYRICE